MASFRKREGRWQARVSRKGQPNVAKTFNCKADAEKWARAIEREQDVGSYVPRNEAEATTVSQLIQRYLQERVPYLRGASTEVVRLATISSLIGQYSLTALNSSVVANYRDKRLLTVSPSTVLREMQTLSAMMNHARSEWNIPITNPVETVRKPTANRARNRRLGADEEQRLMAALEYSGRNETGQWGKGTRNEWVKPVVQLALCTAMRRGELLGLQWKHIDLQKRTAYLPLTKNGESRLVPLSTQAASVLGKLPRSIDGKVFPLTADALKHAWQRACKSANVKNLHFHDLRHEAASRMAQRLANVLELAMITGHKDLRMVQRYVHIRAEELAQKLG